MLEIVLPCAIIAGLGTQLSQLTERTLCRKRGDYQLAPTLNGRYKHFNPVRSGNASCAPQIDMGINVVGNHAGPPPEAPKYAFLCSRSHRQRTAPHSLTITESDGLTGERITMFYSTTLELGRTVSEAFAKVEHDDARVSADQADLIVVLLFVAIGVLLTATVFTASPLAELGQILAGSA